MSQESRCPSNASPSRAAARRLSFLGLFVLAVAAAPLAGCGNIATDRVDQICKCENCGQRQRQEWETKVDAELNIADIYNCTRLLEPYYQCELQEYSCVDFKYQDNDTDSGCKHELDQYMQCLKAQSSRDPGPYIGHP